MDSVFATKNGIKVEWLAKPPKSLRSKNESRSVARKATKNDAELVTRGEQPAQRIYSGVPRDESGCVPQIKVTPAKIYKAGMASLPYDHSASLQYLSMQ